MKWKKPFITLKILKKEERDLMARSEKPKTMNNRFTKPHSALFYCPTIRACGQNKTENTKTD